MQLFIYDFRQGTTKILSFGKQDLSLILPIYYIRPSQPRERERF